MDYQHPRSYYFDCRCWSHEHTLRFNMDVDEVDQTLFTSIFLNDWDRWYKRVWYALKYVFGFKCAYGHWDCWSLDQHDVKKLRGMLDDFDAECSGAEARRVASILKKKLVVSVEGGNESTGK